MEMGGGHTCIQRWISCLSMATENGPKLRFWVDSKSHSKQGFWQIFHTLKLAIFKLAKYYTLIKDMGSKSYPTNCNAMFMVVKKKKSLSCIFISLKKPHLIFDVFERPARYVCLSLKNYLFSVFLYSSMISTFEYKWPPRDGYSQFKSHLPTYRLSLKSYPFSVFLYSSMISTFEYKWPLRDGDSQFKSHLPPSPWKATFFPFFCTWAWYPPLKTSGPCPPPMGTPNSRVTSPLLPLLEKLPFFHVFVLEHDIHLWIHVAPPPQGWRLPIQESLAPPLLTAFSL